MCYNTKRKNKKKKKTITVVAIIFPRRGTVQMFSRSSSFPPQSLYYIPGPLICHSFFYRGLPLFSLCIPIVLPKKLFFFFFLKDFMALTFSTWTARISPWHRWWISQWIKSLVAKLNPSNSLLFLFIQAPIKCEQPQIFFLYLISHFILILESMDGLIGVYCCMGLLSNNN